MNAPGEFLSKPELHKLTDYARVDPQEAWLKAEGIPYKRDGKRLIVLWTHVRAWIEGKPMPVSSGGPNWSTVR